MGELVSLQEAFEQGFEAVKAYIDRKFASFEQRMASLEQQAEITQSCVNRTIEPLNVRVSDLEAHGLKYSGVWEREGFYRKGSVVTDHGAAWVAKQDVGGVRPGGNNDWQLMVRAGRDAK